MRPAIGSLVRWLRGVRPHLRAVEDQTLAAIPGADPSVRPRWTEVSRGLTFTRDWASAAYWDDLLSDLGTRVRPPCRILEIGSFEGLTTAFLLTGFDALGCDVRITCIDTWEGSLEHQPGQRCEVDFGPVERRFDANLRLLLERLPGDHTLRKLRELSSEALPRLLAQGERFDLIFVDGSHEAHDVLLDGTLALELAAPGGTIVFDDYNWLRKKRDATLGAYHAAPRTAIDAITNINRHRVSVVGPASLTKLTLRRADL